MKLKKVVSCFILCVLILVVFISCGTNIVLPDSPQSSETDSQSIQGNKPDEFITEKEGFTVNIYDITSFSEGIAFVKYVVSNRETHTYYEQIVAINTQGQFLFEIPLEAGATNWNNLYYSNGVIVIDDTLYDQNFNVIASPEKNAYQKLLYRTDDYFLVYKREESFSGDTQSLGVLNTKGEWIVPLSDKHPIAKELNELRWGNESIRIDELSIGGKKNIINFEISFTNDGCINNAKCLYDFQTNQFSILDYYFPVKPILDQFAVWHGCNDSGDTTFCGIYKYNFDGAKELLIKGHEIEIEKIYDDVIVCRARDNWRDPYKYSLYSKSGKKLADYSNYNITSFLDYYDEKLCCIITNPTGTEYVALIDNDENLVYEPIKAEFVESGCMYCDENGFLLYSSWYSKYALYDDKGNVTKFENIHRIEKYDPQSNLALVISNRGYVYMAPDGTVALDPLKVKLPYKKD